MKHIEHYEKLKKLITISSEYFRYSLQKEFEHSKESEHVGTNSIACKQVSHVCGQPGGRGSGSSMGTKLSPPFWRKVKLIADPQ